MGRTKKHILALGFLGIPQTELMRENKKKNPKIVTSVNQTYKLFSLISIQCLLFYFGPGLFKYIFVSSSSELVRMLQNIAWAIYSKPIKIMYMSHTNNLLLVCIFSIIDFLYFPALGGLESQKCQFFFKKEN